MASRHSMLTATPMSRRSPAGRGGGGGSWFTVSTLLYGLVFVSALALLVAPLMVFGVLGRGGGGGGTGSTQPASGGGGSVTTSHGRLAAAAGAGCTSPLATLMSLPQYGSYPLEHTPAGGRGDEWLDDVGDLPPPIVPSHYARVRGEEPFEGKETKPFQLHTIPTDEWYDVAYHAVARCDLELHDGITGAGNGLADDVVWVSGLFDLKRGESGNKDFQRSMDEYYSRFNRILDRGFKMVIFIPAEFEPHLHIDRSRIAVIHMNMTQLEHYFPYYDRVQAIRTSKLWNHQADLTGWLSNAPQARLPGYNPLVMSKLMLLKDAARLNPWGVRYHMWMDAGHLCATGQNPTPEGTSMYREHMSKGMFVTHWPYATTTEVHGLTDEAMHIYMAQAEDPLRIVRGGIFGGTLPRIECVLRAYMLALHATLTDGYIGTEECIWAMIHKRFPHLFDSFDNNSLGGFGDNCASFTASSAAEADIQAGRKAVFRSPAVPTRAHLAEAGDGGSGGGGGSGVVPQKLAHALRVKAE